MAMLDDGLETSALEEFRASGLVLNFLDGYRTESSRHRDVEADNVDLDAEKGDGPDAEANKLVFLFVQRW